MASIARLYTCLIILDNLNKTKSMVESFLFHQATIHYAAISLTCRAARNARVVARLGSKVSGLTQGRDPSQQQLDNSVRRAW